VRVSSEGAEITALRERRILLDHPLALAGEPIEFGIQVPSPPAFYRVEILIENAKKETLGRYSEYFRTIPEVGEAKLSVGAREFEPGDLVPFRIQNMGTRSLAFGMGKTLEHRSPSGWKLVPREDEFYGPVALEMQGGAVGPCEGVRLPPDLDAGLYRMSKRVSFGGPGKGFRLYGVFRVS